MMVLVYQGYGRDYIIRQTLFSVTSLLSHLNSDSPLKIVVYTDKPDIFAAYWGQHPKIQLRPIEAIEIQKWRGAIDFVHRVKLEILLDAEKKFNGNLFYVDSDTYFLADPTVYFSKVNDQTSIMHIAESVLSEAHDPLTKKILKFIKKNAFSLNGQPTTMAVNTVMWNAGAIGLSQKNKYLLNEALQLTDQMYSIYPKHVMEQLAVSYVLQDRTQILPLDNIVTHYWNQKEDYQTLIDQFLNENINLSDALASYKNISWPPKKLVVQKKTIWQRLFT
jgi:hypothetical protein